MSENKENQIQTYNPQEAAKAQYDYCKRTNSPHFAPGNGNCYRCNKNIYVRYENSMAGISVQKAGKELITGCPHCNRSYCD